MEKINLTKDFDDPRSCGHYIDMLEANGTPHVYLNSDEIMVFEDQDEHDTWMKLAYEPGGYFEKQLKRNELKEKIDLMSDEEICDLLEKINKRENEDEDNK